MDIDAAETGQVEHPLREDLAVGGYDDEIGRVFLEPCEGFAIEANGLFKWYLCGSGHQVLDRRWSEHSIPPDRFVGLGVDGNDIVSARQQVSEDMRGELGCAHEDNAYPGDIGFRGRSHWWMHSV